MQSITWYLSRLNSMSPDEIWWRIVSLGKQAINGLKVSCGFLPIPKFAAGVDANTAFKPNFRVCNVPLGYWVNRELSDCEQSWLSKLKASADKIMDHRLSFFDLHDHFMGNPIDWHKDHASEKRATLALCSRINYRKFDMVGDCKLVWEPNRHHHLVVLGRAYRVTGDLRYAEEVVAQIDSWLEQNPFGRGMNWRSPLELGVRLINWVWAIDLILESGLFAGPFQSRLLNSIYLHLQDISDKYSLGSSANNHLVGEAAGVFVASSYFSVFADSESWCEQSHRILEQQIVAQTYPDGCTREQALGYQFFVFQFYLVSGMVGRNNNSDFSPSFWSTLQQMLMFTARLAEGGGELPMFGDRDNGYVLDLGDAVDDTNALMAIGKHLFEQEIFASLSIKPVETIFWMFDKDHARKFQPPNKNGSGKHISSVGFESSGHYLLQYSSSDGTGKVSIVFDCADLGYKSIAAHGHADALSFTMRINDMDLFVDPGTYDYFTYPEWRNYFRSTRAHNTVEIDGRDQSEMQGPFMWGVHAQSSCKEWLASPQGGLITAQHDGYQRLADPVMHQRKLELKGDERSLLVTDQLNAGKKHKVAIRFHLSESSILERVEKNCCVINISGVQIKVVVDKKLKITTFHGSESPIAGWLSRGYHRKVPITTIVASGSFTGDSSYCFDIKW